VRGKLLPEVHGAFKKWHAARAQVPELLHLTDDAHPAPLSASLSTEPPGEWRKPRRSKSFGVPDAFPTLSPRIPLP
jgi:hypothetical protein